MNPLMQPAADPYALLRNLNFNVVPQYRPIAPEEWTYTGDERTPPPGAVQLISPDNGAPYWAMPDGGTATPVNAEGLADWNGLLGGFESKYNNFRVMPDGSIEGTLQQPGAHKYDTMTGIWRQGPDGQWQLANDPSTMPTRQTSSLESYRDIADKVAYLGAIMGGAYAGGVGLENLGAGAAAPAVAGGGGLGTLGTLPAVPGAVAPLSTAGLGAVSMPSLGGGAAAAGGFSLSSLGDFARSPSFWGPIVEGGLGLLGQNQAIRAADRASDAQINLLREMNAQNRADNQPLLNLRNSVLPQINALMQNPSSLSQQPDYQFGLNEGNRQIANRQAASGNYYSGGALREAQRFGQDYAGSKLDQSLNRLMGVAGLGQVGGNNQQSANTNFGNMAGNALMNQGANRASGYMGITNTLGGAANAWFNNWQRNALGGP